MLKENIVHKFEANRTRLLEETDKDLNILIKIIADSDISVLRAQIVKSIDFIIVKLIQLHPYYSIVLKEVKEYAHSANDKKHEMNMHRTVRSYLYKMATGVKSRYEKCLFFSLYFHIAGLYDEHRYAIALLYEFSSAFLAMKDVDALEKNFQRIRGSILLSIAELEKRIKYGNSDSEVKNRRTNTELIHIHNRMVKAKSPQKEEQRLKREQERRVKRKNAEKRISERCMRVHVKSVMDEVRMLEEKLKGLEKEHLRRYYIDLYEDIKNILIEKDGRYDALFASIAQCYKDYEKKTASKRRLTFILAQLTGYAKKKGGSDLKEAKIIPPALFEAVGSCVKTNEMKLIFDMASNRKEDASIILKRELERIERTRKEVSYPHP